MPPDTICDVFEIAPRLFRVELLSAPHGLKLPWTQLTDISFMSMHRIDEYLTVLSDCPYLLSMFEGVEDDIHATSRFRQSMLRHSHLRVKHIPCFFDCLAMPKLRTIHLISMTMYAFYEAVFHFLSRSSRTIVKLI